MSGCHGSKGLNEFEIPEEFDTAKNYEITFWAKNDNNRSQQDIYKKAISDFEKLYPNIKVNMRLYSDYGRIYNDVITNISTSTTPNVCITYPDHIATYMSGINIVVPLDALIDDPSYGLGGSKVGFDSPARSEVVPEFLNECYLNGACYALPFMRSTEALYINEDLVKALGYEVPDILTWDYVWEVSEKATEKDASGNYTVNGQKVLIPFIYKSTDNMMISMLKQKKAGYSTDAGDIEIFNDTTKEIMTEVSKHARTGAFSTFKISSYPGNFMNAGQCILAVDSTAGATWMGSHAPLSDIHDTKKVEFETVVRPVPQYDANDVQMISQGPSICIFNKDDPQEVLASWLFAQFLLTNEMQETYSETEGYVPVTLKAQNDPAYLEYLSLGGSDNGLHYGVKIDCVKMVIENTDNTFITPVFNGSASLRNAAGQMVENCVKTVRRGGTVDGEYLDRMYSDVSQMYRLGELKQDNSISRDLGPLPGTAIALLTCIAAAWACMGLYVLKDRLFKKKPL
jgi:multiple sugar transport system substrate-binding protein